MIPPDFGNANVGIVLRSVHGLCVKPALARDRVFA